MKTERNPIRILWTLLLAVLLSVGLAACTQSPQGESSSGGTSESASASASSSVGQPEKELYGSPWVTSVFVGNQPETAPDAADDLYLHYGYDYLTQHAGFDAASVLMDAMGEPQEAVTATIKDESITSPELEQLRIFYNQAADLDTLGKAGIEELQPYLDRIMATKSLEELNQVLVSDDFPFTPWIKGTVGAADMKSTMGVLMLPNLLFSDELTGGDVYKDSDNESESLAREVLKEQGAANVASDLLLMGYENGDEAREEALRIFDFEKTYGTYTDLQKENLNAEYGTEAQSIKRFSMDELEAAYPNFPIRGTYAKLGKDRADDYIVMYPEWLDAFDKLWTEDNFEMLRTMTAVKVLRECSPYVDPSLYENGFMYSSASSSSADEFAYTACNSPYTFGQLLAKTYVEQNLGDETWEDLTNLSNSLIDSYIDLVNSTPWISAESKEAIIEKIDNMALNILYPDGGYFDYSELNLVPSEQGGTLLSNYLKLKEYNNRCEIALIGQPALANTAWIVFSPTEFNCFYDTTTNSINILPGFVTSAVYTKDMSKEEKLAGIGFVIGHEISHAFDYTGSQYNAYGEPVSIYSSDDEQKFVERRQKLADYYSTIEVEPGVYVNGVEKSTEAAADLCGVQVLLEYAKTQEGFDYEHFFGSLAHDWASSYPQIYASLLYIDVHALDNLRINVSVQMHDEFYETFDVVEGDGMYLAPEDRIVMWGPNA